MANNIIKKTGFVTDASPGKQGLDVLQKAKFDQHLIMNGARVLSGTVVSDLSTRVLNPLIPVTLLSASSISSVIGVTLPTPALYTSASGLYVKSYPTGLMHQIIVDNPGAGCVLSQSNTHLPANVVFTVPGQGALCRYDGSMWSVLSSSFNQ
jgi:hypothetical protein